VRDQALLVGVAGDQVERVPVRLQADRGHVDRAGGRAGGVLLGLDEQLGQFLATVGQQLNILPDAAANTIIAATIVSLTLNPMQYKTVGWMEARLSKWPGLWRALNPKGQSRENAQAIPGESEVFRAIVVGYGPIGQTVSRLLRDGAIEPVIVEGNLNTAHRARNDGRQVIYGDAAHPDILEAAGIDSAVALILSASTTEQTAEIIRIARKTNPALRIIARANYLREADSMRNAGAEAVFAGEGEVALAMTEHILGFLGATPEQIDRERQRVRQDVFSSTARPEKS